MRTIFRRCIRIIASGAFFAVLSTISMPLTLEAKDVKNKKAIQGKDERNFAHPTSRCLTKSMIARNAAVVKQMEKDIKQFGGHVAAAKIYREKLALVWSAMSEPYCGYGSRGIRAVQKSFMKSVERIRVEFLQHVKKIESSVTSTHG